MSIVSDFNPEMLILARRSREMTQAQLSKSSEVSSVTISKYEQGTLNVLNDKLIRLADALQYPMTFFYRSSRLRGVAGGAAFHRKQQSLPTRKLYRAHALAEVRRLEISTMLESLDVQAPPLPKYPVEFYDDDPEKIARSVRILMGVPPGPIFNLTATLECNGCMIVDHDFGSPKIDGFIQHPDYPPCFIHLNSALPPDRWRWTLAHELAHAVMHEDPMKELKEIENQANLFAAEFLAPANEIRPQLNGLTFQKLGGLKREWRISMQALITRAYHLGTISGRQRQTMFMRLAQSGYRTREPETLDPPVEHPSWMHSLAQKHLTELDYSRSELCDLLRITDADLGRYYVGDDDILESLGIRDILR